MDKPPDKKRQPLPPPTAPTELPSSPNIVAQRCAERPGQEMTKTDRCGQPKVEVAADHTAAGKVEHTAKKNVNASKVNVANAVAEDGEADAEEADGYLIKPSGPRKLQLPQSAADAGVPVRPLPRQANRVLSSRRGGREEADPVQDVGGRYQIDDGAPARICRCTRSADGRICRRVLSDDARTPG